MNADAHLDRNRSSVPESDLTGCLPDRRDTLRDAHDRLSPGRIRLSVVRVTAEHTFSPTEIRSPMSATQSVLHEPARQTPVSDHFDLVIVGGSCTGVFAALRAAEQGLRVAIVEQQTAFGGMATNGRVPEWHSTWNTSGTQRVISGLTLACVEALEARGAAKRMAEPGQAPKGRSEWGICAAGLAVLLDELIAKQPLITPFLGTMCVDADVDGGRIRHVVIENVSGRAALACDFALDASGNGALIRVAKGQLWRDEGFLNQLRCRRCSPVCQRPGKSWEVTLGRTSKKRWPPLG